MIKLAFCLVRKEGLSREEFQAYWRDQHANLVLRHAATLGIHRYVQAHTLDTPFNEIVIASRNAPAEYDGVAELWWDSFESMAEHGATDDGLKAAGELTEDERTFIDHTRSPIFFVSEHVVID